MKLGAVRLTLRHHRVCVTIQPPKIQILRHGMGRDTVTVTWETENVNQRVSGAQPVYRQQTGKLIIQPNTNIDPSYDSFRVEVGNDDDWDVEGDWIMEQKGSDTSNK